MLWASKLTMDVDIELLRYTMDARNATHQVMLCLGATPEQVNTAKIGQAVADQVWRFMEWRASIEDAQAAKKPVILH